MFSAWGAFVYRFRRPIAVLAVIIALASTVACRTGRPAPSARAAGPTPIRSRRRSHDRLADEFGAGGGTIVALFRGEAGDDARSDGFQGRITASLDRLVADERVDDVVGWAETQDDRFISTDGTAAYVVVRLDMTDEAAVDEMEELRALIDQPTDLTLQLTGVAPATQDQAEQSEKELIQAETVSFPFAALILVLVFASLVAAGMPLVVAALAIPTTLAGVYHRRAGDGAVDLRPERRDDARAGPRDRLLAVHGQPLPRGAQPWSRRRDGGHDHGRHERQGGHVLGARRRDRPVGTAVVRARCAALVRHRRSAHRGRVRVLRTDVPARRSSACSVRASTRSAWPVSATASGAGSAGRSASQPTSSASRAGSGWRTGSWPGRSPSSSRRSCSCWSSARRSCVSARASPTPASCHRASRAARRRSPCRPSSRPARPRRSWCSPRSTARRPTRPTSSASSTWAPPSARSTTSTVSRVRSPASRTR